MYTEDLICNLSGTIAIVGPSNAPGDFGNVIDQYDNVIRVHNHKIYGYTNKIGSKTTLVCHCKVDLEDWTKDILKISPFQEDSIEVKHMYNCGTPDSTVFSRTNAQENTGLEWPTTGMSLLCLFETLGKQADVFFIDGFKTCYYYQPDTKKTSPHSPEAEQKKLRQLTKLNFITEI